MNNSILNSVNSKEQTFLEDARRLSRTYDNEPIMVVDDTIAQTITDFKYENSTKVNYNVQTMNFFQQSRGTNKTNKTNSTHQTQNNNLNILLNKVVSSHHLR